MNKESIHFVGIGGAGMSGIAKVLLELGFPISGSDLHASETTKRLESMGAKIVLGHNEDNLDPQVGTVVVSSAIPRNNPEVVKAEKLGIPVIQRAEMLGRIMKRQKGIAIAGAHGKTTTSSMISLIFEKNGYDPTVIVGGELNDIGGNAKLGQGEYLVAEADESDGSFLKLCPFITVISNIEDDHLDYYKTKNNIVDAFRHFIMMTAPGGFTVICLDDPNAAQLVPEIRKHKRVVTYGFCPEADFRAENVNLKGLQTTALIKKGEETIGELALSVPGRHNILNALAGVAVGMNCGLSFDKIAASLQTFHGVHRRFEKVGEAEGVQIYDDYAHHPTELKASLAAAKTLKPKRVVAVFQPHRYTRTLLLAEEFGSAFRDADVLIINELYGAGEIPIKGVSAELIVNEVRKQSDQEVEYIKDRADIVRRLRDIKKPGDLIITMGAGNIWKVGFDLYKSMQGQ